MTFPHRHAISFAYASFLMASVALSANIAQAATAQGTVSAEVVQPLQITSHTPLDFGTILPGSGAGEVVVTPHSQRQADSKVLMQQGGYEAASFTIHGTPDRAYSINTPDRLVFHVANAADGTEGISDLQVKDFTTYSKNSGKGDNRGALDSRGEDTMAVGGTLVVPADAAPGHYLGDVPVTVAYQ